MATLEELMVYVNNKATDQMVMICSDCNRAGCNELTLVDVTEGLFTHEVDYAENTCLVAFLDLSPESLFSEFTQTKLP